MYRYGPNGTLKANHAVWSDFCNAFLKDTRQELRRHSCVDVRPGNEHVAGPGEGEAALEQELFAVGGDDLAGAAAQLDVVQDEPRGDGKRRERGARVAGGVPTDQGRVITVAPVT